MSEEELEEEEGGLIKKLLSGLAGMPLLGFGLLFSIAQKPRKKEHNQTTEPPPSPHP